MKYDSGQINRLMRAVMESPGTREGGAVKESRGTGIRLRFGALPRL